MPAARRVVYDGNGRVESVQAGTVASQSDGDWPGFAPQLRQDIGYDAHNRPKIATTSGGGVTSGVTQVSYDALGRVDCVAQRMDPAQWANQADPCTAQTNGASGPDRIVRTGYDALDRATSVTIAYGTTAASTETQDYGGNGQVAWVKDGENNRTDYGYDGYGRLTTTYYPLPSAGSGAANPNDYEQLTLDANGNVTQRQLRDGQLIGYSYDALGRLTSRNSPNVAY